MSILKAGIIGCGRPKTERRPYGGQAHRHVVAYKKPQFELVALADIAHENIDAFRDEHFGADADIRSYLDYRELLEKEDLDIVSICTWPGLHAPMVQAAAEAGVKIIYCEKPMAPNFGDAKKMVEACEKHGVTLAFNHQRRMGEPFRKAKEMLKSGEIGELRRLEGACSNLFDWGTHWFDMFFFYNDETPVEWVIGQMEWRGSRTVFGAPIENQGLSHFKFQNEVHGLLITGSDAETQAGVRNRLVGTKGVLELGLRGPEFPNGHGPSLRILGKGDGWQEVPTSEGLDANEATARGIVDAVEAVRDGREPELAARRALQATELIFATYESSRRRGRVELPLQIEDSPLQAILDENAEPEASA